MSKPPSGRPHKLTEWNHQVLKHVACKNGLSSVATLTTELQTGSGSNVSTRTVRLELHELGFHGLTATHKPKIALSGVMNHASPAGRPTEESGFGVCQENATYPNA